MRKILILLLVLFLYSCDEDLPLISENSPPNEFVRIASIAFNQGSPFREASWTRVFQYDNSNLLTRTDNDRPIAEYKIYEYDPLDRIREIKTFYTEDNQLIFRDSIVYSNEGLLNSIYQFSINSSATVGLYAVQSYAYHSNGVLSSVTQRHIPTNEIWRIQKFTWDQNNITKIEDYSSDEELQHEWFFTYDNKKNYQFNNPAFINEVLSRSINNVKESDVIDHTGLLDIVCYKCVSEYEYDVNDLPQTISNGWGTTLTFNYR